MKKFSKIFVISGPSGVGKNTVVAQINFKKYNLETPISYTTRTKREEEIAGRDYNFITKEKFLKFLKKNLWLEYTFFNENYYGMLKNDFEKVLKNGKNIIAILDIEGARQVKKHFPSQTILIFMRTTLAQLEKRLIARGQNTPEQIQKRLAVAKKELEQSQKIYDYFITNQHNQINKSIQDLEKIIAKNLEKT